MAEHDTVEKVEEFFVDCTDTFDMSFYRMGPYSKIEAIGWASEHGGKMHITKVVDSVGNQYAQYGSF